MIRILLVDDQFLLCEVLKTWLEVEDDFQVIGVAHDGQEGLEQVAKLQPDIVLMDIDMPGMDGLSATEQICDRFPQVKVIFLSGHDDDNYLGKSLRAGAKGYLLKNTTAEELAAKIRSVYQDQSHLLDSGDRRDFIALQTQVEELIETYRHKFQKQLDIYRQSLAELNQIAELDSSYEKRLQEIEHLWRNVQEQQLPQIQQENKITWESIRAEINNVHSQLSDANHALSSQMNQQLVNLKHDLDSQLKNALDEWSRQRATLQEWAVQRDEMHQSPQEVENRYRQELMLWTNPIRTSLRNADRKIQTLRTWLIAIALIAVVSLGFSSWVLVSNFLGNFSANPIRQSNNR
ncbi:MAG TPA: response regulator [Xenococcaceae cyanobacterium]